MERVMITLPENLLDLVDEAARRQAENRSQFIRGALRERLHRMEHEALEVLLEEGYRQMAEELASSAVDGQLAQSSALTAAPWDE